MKLSSLWFVDTVYADEEETNPTDNSNEGGQTLNLGANGASYEWQTPPTTSLAPGEAAALDSQSKAACSKMYGSFFTPSNTVTLFSSDDCACTVNNDLVQCSQVPNEVLTQQCIAIKGSTWSIPSGSCSCAQGLADNEKECLVNNYGDIGLKCSAQDILYNTCTRNINKTLGIKPSNPNPSPEGYVQDIVLAGTSLLGTGLFFGLLAIFLRAIFKGGSGSEDQMSTIKSGLKLLLIGAFLILAAYSIIRLIQYIIRGY